MPVRSLRHLLSCACVCAFSDIVLVSVKTVLAGKLAAEVIAERSAGWRYSVPMKDIEPVVYERARRAVPKDPVGVKGEGAIAFGGGAVWGSANRGLVEESDPIVLRD